MTEWRNDTTTLEIVNNIFTGLILKVYALDTCHRIATIAPDGNTIAVDC